VRKSLTALGVAVALQGCATFPVCRNNAGPIGRLECAAAAGSKEAQLALGKAYEKGDGILQDYKRAAKLYRMAGSPTSGTIYVYSPPVGKAPGQVLPLRAGPDRPPLGEALYRLSELYRAGLGVERDVKKADQLVEAARQGGYTPRETD